MSDEVAILRAKVEYCATTPIQLGLAAAAWGAIREHCNGRYDVLREDHLCKYDTEMHLKSLIYELRTENGDAAAYPGIIHYMRWVIRNVCTECIANDSEIGQDSHE